MSKKRAWAIIISMALFLGVLTFTAAFGWGKDHLGATKNIITGLDLSGGVSITYQAVGEKTPSAEDMKDTVYKMQQRVFQYDTEGLAYQEGNDRITIEIPGVSDADAILAELGTPGSLKFISQTDSEGKPNYERIGQDDYVLTKTLEEIQKDGGIIMEGTDVSSASAGSSLDEMKNKRYVVNMIMTDEGAKKFATGTTNAYQKNETIAIYYDGQFVSVPSVSNGPITDGHCEISGMEDLAGAESLASFIRIGGLKVELKELRSSVVGAQLGEEAISTSLMAGIVGVLAVIVFMIAIYLMPGVVAAISLLIYTALMLVLMNAFDFTLTLPGIAGIILSIGMAVDANVIIYARIREEIGEGRPVQTAIKTGFDKALSAIVDGNVTTMIAAIVLGILGTGPIKGFAQTLALGIVLSMITALFLSRLLVNALYTLGMKNEKLYGKQKPRKTIDFVGKRKYFFAIGIIVILTGPIAMIIQNANGQGMFNYSLDFVGGTSSDVTFNEEFSIVDIDEKVKPVIESITGDANIQTQKVAGTNRVIIKTRELSLSEREEMNDILQEKFAVDSEKTTMESISSTVSGEMKRDAIVAVVVALFFMLIYIWFRFKDIRFGTGAVIAILHDLLVIIAFYAIARVPVGSTFIAVLLTLLGYSINATVVIFDRVRENSETAGKKGNMADLINNSVTQTLTRNINTTFSTFITITILYIMGVPAIKEFALPIIIGIMGSVYSDICITGPLLYVLKTKLGTRKKAVS